MKQFLLLLISFILLSCYSKNADFQTASVLNELSREQTEKANSDSTKTDNSDIDFESFLKEFSANEEFQLARIDFPLKVILLDIDDKEEIKTILKEEWQHTNLLDTANIETLDIDAYSQRTDLSESESIIKLRGIDNGIRIDYIFKLRERLWYLTEILNASN